MSDLIFGFWMGLAITMILCIIHTLLWVEWMSSKLDAKINHVYSPTVYKSPNFDVEKARLDEMLYVDYKVKLWKIFAPWFWWKMYFKYRKDTP